MLEVKIIETVSDVLSDLFGAFRGPMEDAVVVTAGAEVYKHWRRLASERLHTSKAAYLEGLTPPVRDAEGRVVIELKGTLPLMVEFGASSFNIRDAMLKGQKSRVVKFELPGSRRVLMQALEQAYAPIGQENALKLGRRIARRARAIGPGQRLSAQQIPSLGSSRPEIYVGMMRRQYPSTTRHMRSELVMFRTMTAGQAENAWQHQGIEAHNFASETLNAVPDIIANILANVVAGVVGGRS